MISNEPRGDTDWEIGPYQQLVRTLDPTRLIVRTGDYLGTDDSVTIHPTLNYTNAHDGELALMARRAAANKDPRRALGSTEYMNYLGRAPRSSPVALYAPIIPGPRWSWRRWRPKIRRSCGGSDWT